MVQISLFWNVVLRGKPQESLAVLIYYTALTFKEQKALLGPQKT